ncbi:MAG TPA: ABC transporter substrate-binding protein [Burkholderiales bacterium]|nr:ABC transporter substrate-binding protein [Burkholderiales bacterium]
MRLTHAHPLWRIALLAFAMSMVAPAAAKETLRVLTWPGYADSDFVAAFEKANGVTVEVTFINSDDVLWEKMNAREAADFDVFAANTSEMTRYIDRGLSQPLDVANIPNTAHQLPRFRDLQAIPGISRNGRVYAIPYTYSEMGLIYDRKQFRKPPDSMDAMWDPRFKGKVLAYNGSTHNFSIAALLLGSRTPFRISDAEFKRAVDRLIALRRNVLTFYSSPEESIELFRENSVALMFANYGTQQVEQLRKAGADIGYVIPREGALAWLDCWGITRGARNKRLAERWINYMLEKDVSAALVKRQGLANTVEPSPYTDNSNRLIWLEPVENYKLRATLWDRIISGDTPTKF